MKFATALLFAAVAHAAEEKKEEEKKGAKKGEACDANGTDTGCADGLRCHLGVAAASGTKTTDAKATDPCEGKGRNGWLKDGTASCEY